MKFFRRTAASLVLFALATLLIYGLLVGMVNFVSFGGEPLVNRLVPLQNPGGPSHSLVRFREIEVCGQVDVVFLGSSHAYRGFDPRLFAAAGLTSANLGSTSQTPLNTRRLLERYLDKLKPKFVIYEVYQGAFGIDGMESFYDLLSNTPIDDRMVCMAWDLDKPQVWTALLSTVIRNARVPLESYVQRGKEGRDDQYVEGGYVQTTAQFPPDRLARLRQNSALQPNPMDDRQFESLRACIEYTRSRGITFVACSYPIPVETRNLLEGYKENKEEIGRFFAAERVPYRDFNDEIVLETGSFYYDEVHLNQSGVDVFNDSLLEWLEDLELVSSLAKP